jgi:hypothetical protein
MRLGSAMLLKKCWMTMVQGVGRVSPSCNQKKDPKTPQMNGTRGRYTPSRLLVLTGLSNRTRWVW